MVETSTIAMPALSSTMTEGKISEWLVSEGDKVSSGDMVLVVESDKADMDVETYEEGYIAKILVGDGETASVGAPVAILVANKEDIDAAAAGGGGSPAAAPEPAAAAPAAPAAAAVRAAPPSFPASAVPLPVRSAAALRPRASTAQDPGVPMAQIMMPALSSTMTEGKISEWLKEVGDKVDVGDMVLVVESDKADMDVESFEEGYLAKILTPDGETAAVGAPVRNRRSPPDHHTRAHACLPRAQRWFCSSPPPHTHPSCAPCADCAARLEQGRHRQGRRRRASGLCARACGRRAR